MIQQYFPISNIKFLFLFSVEKQKYIFWSNVMQSFAVKFIILRVSSLCAFVLSIQLGQIQRTIARWFRLIESEDESTIEVLRNCWSLSSWNPENQIKISGTILLDFRLHKLDHSVMYYVMWLSRYIRFHSVTFVKSSKYLFEKAINNPNGQSKRFT